jgi:hypothetical protein
MPMLDPDALMVLINDEFLPRLTCYN